MFLMVFVSMWWFKVKTIADVNGGVTALISSADIRNVLSKIRRVNQVKHYSWCQLVGLIQLLFHQLSCINRATLYHCANHRILISSCAWSWSPCRSWCPDTRPTVCLRATASKLRCSRSGSVWWLRLVSLVHTTAKRGHHRTVWTAAVERMRKDANVDVCILCVV